jgi:hypothetical protein
MSKPAGQRDSESFPGQLPQDGERAGERAGEAGPAAGGGGGGGNASVGPSASLAESSPAREGPAFQLDVMHRCQAAGVWKEAETVKDSIIRESRDKLGRKAAKAHAWREIARMYLDGADPDPVECDNVAPAAVPVPAAVPASDGLSGLHDVPASWPELPAGSSLQSDLAWVQSNRLAVVEERSPGVTVVHLDRAHEPAPSRAALGWLETSVRSYAKYVDVVARTLRDEADEAETVRRERLAINEIRDLLSEMTAHAAS